MAGVDLTEERIGFAHTLQYGHAANPEGHAHAEAPPCREAKGQAHRREDGDEHKLAIAADNLIGPIRGLVNDHFAWPVRFRHNATRQPR